MIRKAVATDAKGIANVHVDSWRTTYKGILPDALLDNLSYSRRMKQWEQNIAQQHVFVVENDQGEIVGFSAGGKERTGKYPSYTGELYAIYILQAYQGKGLGKLLVQPVVDVLRNLDCHSMLVLVLKENDATYFYEAIGGKQVDVTEETIAGQAVIEVAYGWDDLNSIGL
ncbi:GNAT family N-acetyltransferase [Lentibacillus sp. N15]|uniref:GNAT family N-acetyltransferase n=1 Tax=Lentibacillus songyuanensis TaxID=3136161 RepID=UPI0031BB8A1F